MTVVFIVLSAALTPCGKKHKIWGSFTFPGKRIYGKNQINQTGNQLDLI